MNIHLSQIEVRLPLSPTALFKVADLKIPTGEKLLIKGPSGRGKTTLLHLIAGLFLPYNGNIHIGETRLNSLTDEERTRFRREHFGIIFQKLNLLDHLTPVENVLLSLGTKPEAWEKARLTLSHLELDQRLEHTSNVLSLGEQQRVAIARVLAAEPPIILADEPTSSLDHVNTDRVIKALIGKNTKQTAVVVSHDERIEKYFSRVIDFSEFAP